MRYKKAAKIGKKPETLKTTAKFQTFPVVVVNWVDACEASSDGWTSVEEFEPQLLTAQAVGYKVFEGKNKWGEDLIVLSAAVTFHPDGLPHFVESFTIPKGMITSIKEIKV